MPDSSKRRWADVLSVLFAGVLVAGLIAVNVGAQGPPPVPHPEIPNYESVIDSNGQAGSWEIRWAHFTLPPKKETRLEVDCPEGKQVHGGGFQPNAFLSSGEAVFEIRASFPQGPHGGDHVSDRHQVTMQSGWVVSAVNTWAWDNSGLWVYAVCAKPTTK